MFRYMIPFAISVSLLFSTLVDASLSTAPVVDDGFLRLKDRVDFCIDNDRDKVIRVQISDALDFTLKSLNKEDPYIHCAMINLGMAEGDCPELNMDEHNRNKYLTVLGGFFSIKESLAQDVCSGYEVLLAAKACAVLLELFVTDSGIGYKRDHYLTEAVQQEKSKIHKFGQNAEIMLKSGKISYRMKTYLGNNKYSYFYKAGDAPDYASMSVSDRNVLASNDKQLYKEYPCVSHTLVPNNFMPLALCENDALFTEKGFLYAFSKGVFLLGVFDKPLAGAHGGVWDMPVAALLHDLGHGSDMLIPAAYGTAARQIARNWSAPLVSKLLVDLAKTVYDLFEDPSVFKVEERPKAIRAAFYLFHETIPYDVLYEMLAKHSWMPSEQSVWKMLDEDKTWESVMQPLDKKPIEARSLLDIVCSMAKSFAGDRLSRNGEMEKRVASDIPRDALEVQEPSAKEALELEIYGKDNHNRTTHYNGDKALELMCEIINWFSDRIKNHESMKRPLESTLARN
jgi:hypothetical protein